MSLTELGITERKSERTLTQAHKAKRSTTESKFQISNALTAESKVRKHPIEIIKEDDRASNAARRIQVGKDVNKRSSTKETLQKGH